MKLRFLAAPFVAGALVGCGLLSDPTAHKVTCDVTGAALEALAADLGLPPAIVVALYEPACMAAVKLGATQEQATQAGKDGVKLSAAKLKKVGVKLEASP